MTRYGLLIAGIGVLALAAAQAQQAGTGQGSSAPKLTPQDYVDIQQLAARYAFAIDSCTNGGYDYADLYTADGEFSVAEQWGATSGQRRFHAQGRDALAVAAGGGKDGCRDPKTLMGYGISHIVTNHVVTPTATGAEGKSYLLAIGVGGKPTQIELQGGYEDVYVKTADGWRFRSRVHVFPNIAESVQFGTGGSR